MVLVVLAVADGITSVAGTYVADGINSITGIRGYK